MKRIRNLLILSVTLLVLIGGYFAVRNFVKDDSTADTEEPAETYTVSDITPEELCSLDVKVTESSDGETTVHTLSFVLNADSTAWLWSEDNNVPLDNTAFANVVTALSEATSATKMTEVSDSKLEEYGLVTPYIEATFGFSGGEKVTYKIGKQNSFNSMYYFCNAAEPATVYMVSSDVASTLNMSVASCLLWDEVPEITAAKISTISFELDGRSLVYKHYPTGKDDDYTSEFTWYLSVDSGAELAVSPDLGTGLENLASGLSFLDVVQYTGEIKEEYGFANSSATMTVSYTSVESVEDSNSGTTTEISRPAIYVLTLGVQDEDGCYYAKTQDSQLIYTLNYSEVIETAVSDNLSDIKPTGLAYLDFSRIDKIKLTAGEKSLCVTVAHTEDSDTYTDDSGAEFKYDAFTAVTNALADASATSYTSLVDPVSTVGTDLVFSAEITFNTGSVTNAVLEIRNYSESYCRVSFMGRDDQLISLDGAQSLVTLLNSYFD